MKHPPITFRGALQILGHYDRPWLDKVNGLVGGIVLATGLAPDASPISPMWGWIDQKNEGTGLLRTALDGAAARLTDTAGLERRQLVIAAHTALVMSAFFDAVAASPLGALYAEAAVADRYKLQLAGASAEESESTVRALYKIAVPIPTAAIGFYENVPLVQFWAAGLYRRTFNYIRHVLDELIEPKRQDELRESLFEIRQTAGEKYQSYYLEFSGRVPEFAIWSNSMEHAATRSAMGSLEQLLSQVAGSAPQARDTRSAMRRVNAGVLRAPVLDLHTDGYGFDTPFPSVEALFVKPDCRVATALSTARISSEDWWQDTPVSEDLCVVLARHFTSADATSSPLLLLGHPGAGKSLVTKMIAARLPASQYTVVCVPLRHVDANALLSDQVQEALNQSTHGRVQWADLVEQSTGVTRVLLLDGLDELLQASTSDRTDYLVRIAEFQRREADMGFPVAVVVTSRTLVADRVKVPQTTSVIKLEEFSDDQISEWVRNWNDANTSALLPEMSAQWALTHRHLASQPLLLLMLTLYRANRGTDAEDELSSADLYGRLFDDFARREIVKREGSKLQGQAFEDAVDQQLRTLAIVALGMFNRGRQDITEPELSDDLKTLEANTSGKRLLAEFFFIHSPEAQATETIRSYEFLHATFAEYLVADRVVDALRDVAEGAFGRRVRHAPEDDLLFALLSHQPLAIQQPVLKFVQDKLAELDPVELDRIRQTLDVLLTGYRGRLPSRRFGDYRPTPFDGLRSMGTYSANLVLLRIQQPLSGVGAPLTEMFATDKPLPQWRATVDLWKSSLDEAAYHAILGAVDLVDGGIVARIGLTGFVPQLQALHHARLLHDRETLSQLRHGAALMQSTSYMTMRGSGESRAWEWQDHISAWLKVISAGELRTPSLARSEMPSEVPTNTQEEIARRAANLIQLGRTSQSSSGTSAMKWLADQLGEIGETISEEIRQQEVRDVDEPIIHLSHPPKPKPQRQLAREAAPVELNHTENTAHHDLENIHKLIEFKEVEIGTFFFPDFTYYCVSFIESDDGITVNPIVGSRSGLRKRSWTTSQNRTKQSVDEATDEAQASDELPDDLV
ncbi:ATP-binding protein [Lentzea sp. NBC_00516]|uniref:NACHT domain-containing protein n=1 Tax=Lentzea sp. NBC_00516 TaxID=2903582 RepID=UPI002E81B2C6|nr:AAA family ATPase [Lentzea sp. NBC_00516]WUD23597.1 ATP-binding protein [Lentzea sp. NBC_00516]